MRCDNPILIGGCGSSGTTLLSHLLSKHPEIYCGPEWYIAHVPQLFRKWSVLSADHRRQLLMGGIDGVPHVEAETLSWLVNGQRCSVTKFVNRKHRRGRAADDATLIEWARGAASLPEFADLFFGDLLHKACKTRWCEKTPVNCYAIGEILEAYSQARYIHTVRDGRDVALSLMARSYDARQAVQRWLYDTSTIFPFIDHPRCLLVKYEELVQSPEQTLGEVLVFIGSDPELAQTMIQAASGGKADFRAVRSWSESPTNPISAKHIGKWRGMEHGVKAELARYFHHVFLSPDCASRLGLGRALNANAVNRAFGYPRDPAWPEGNALSFALLKEFLRERRGDVVTAPYSGISLVARQPRSLGRWSAHTRARR